MECTLRVGEKAVVRGRFFRRSWYVAYAGMPADDRYSIVMTWSMGHQASSYNLYFDASTKEIRFDGGELKIQEVSSDWIRFRCDDRHCRWNH